MDVSNSTEKSTDYRVSSSGGGQPLAPPVPKTGKLGPRERQSLDVPHGQSWTIEFSVDGSVVASCVVRRKDAKVELVNGAGGFRAEVS